MTAEGFDAEQIDTSRPHPARMYDYYLGGQDNYEVDRIAAEKVLSVAPDVRLAARENRAFLHRAVRVVAERGIRQFVDVGTGIPTTPNTHQVAREVDPTARVAYVDNDPIVSVYAGAKLTAEGNAGFVLGDLRDPEALMENPVIRDLIDFDQPVALMLVAILHFIDDEAQPTEMIQALTSRLAPGSCLVLSHATSDFHDAEDVRRVREVYRNSTANVTPRGRSAVEAFFDGFDVLEPGVVQPHLWRPDAPVPDSPELARLAGYAGVGVKP
ncbi:SAM-dependent methyltransferase [Streptomyces triticirhizae]|uniref:SAM-dependent methyltransferase n=1 Tax=Streptomyces triticirhizae TaxID=2483353 RepID=A0A3M2LKY2_9ACTN|nr:SAM-dependent methyltransferase [Streptomyces triticirhizae]RMI36715.1 SAM-dependent methyltransferase [Streptomyces triticirhizae]